MSTLATIRTKIRRVTARPSSNQITDTELDEYINDFLVYDLPSITRLLYNKQTYSFQLTPNVASYSINAFKNQYMTFEPPAYVDGFQMQYMQDQQTFYQMFPKIKYSVQISTGSGVAGPYGGSYSYTPIEPTTAVVSAVDAAGNNVLAIDDGTGGFVDETGAAIVGATINYVTGIVAGITFTAVVPVGNVIYMAANNYQRGRPFSVLYFNNEFRFWPFPDRAYTFQITVYKNPEELLADGQSPELNVWADVIVYGTSMKIFGDNLDMESYAKVQILFDDHKRLAERRTLKQLSTQRVSTIYGSANDYPSGAFGYPYQ